MSQTQDSIWLESITQQREGYEIEAVQRFADRLIRLARSRMPARLQRRVDPEDVVQSAFRSFFERNSRGQFQFQEIPDVWKLLSAITFRKVQKSIRFHQQQQRDINKEEPTDGSPVGSDDATASSLVVMMDLLDGILERIPEEHRRILQMRLEEHTIDEIAEQVGVSTRTVSRAIALVRKVATDLLEDYET